MKLSVLQFLKFVYWTFRRDGRQAAGHMLGVLPTFIRNAVQLNYRNHLRRNRPQTVALALTEHMGDIVAAEPIARLARRRFPNARITWVTRAAYRALPDSYPDIDEVVIVTCLTEWMLLQRLNLFDVVWDLHVNGRDCPVCSVPQIRPGVKPDFRNYYQFGCLLDVECDCANVPRLTDAPIIAPPAAALMVVDALRLPSHFIAIHCVSNAPGRDWPAEKWRDLIGKMLLTYRVAVVEVGLRPMVISKDDERQRSLCGRLGILETAEVIRRADLFIGIDSGPAHLANAVGTQGVILLGAYLNFHSYMPYSGGYANGQNAAIVRADGPVAVLPVETVLAAVADRASLMVEHPPVKSF